MSKKTDSRIGTVVWFNGRQGYGWINVDGEEQDAYVHFSDINAKGYKTLEDGQKVKLTLVRQDNDMLKAIKVTMPNGSKIENDKKLIGSKDPPPKGKNNNASYEDDRDYDSGDKTTGVVTSFRGNYGWIELDDGSGDAYVHWTEIMGGDGYKKLQPGDKVEFVAIHQNGGRMKAVQVMMIGGKRGGGGGRGRGRGRGRGGRGTGRR